MARTVNEGNANEGSGSSLFRPSERFVLDPDSPVPLYYQLEQVLVDRISKEDAVAACFPRKKN